MAADHTSFAEQRYPGAGQPNAKVPYPEDRAWVWQGEGRPRRCACRPRPNTSPRLVRRWRTLAAIWLTRDQTRLDLVEFDRRSAAPHTLVSQRDRAWVETHDDLAELSGRLLGGKPSLVWSSERSGRRQLWLLDHSGGEPQPDAAARGGEPCGLRHRPAGGVRRCHQTGPGGNCRWPTARPHMLRLADPGTGATPSPTNYHRLLVTE